jgi:hypothetical protein
VLAVDLEHNPWPTGQEEQEVHPLTDHRVGTPLWVRAQVRVVVQVHLGQQRGNGRVGVAAGVGAQERRSRFSGGLPMDCARRR